MQTSNTSSTVFDPLTYKIEDNSLNNLYLVKLINNSNSSNTKDLLDYIEYKISDSNHEAVLFIACVLDYRKSPSLLKFVCITDWFIRGMLQQGAATNISDLMNLSVNAGQKALNPGHNVAIKKADAIKIQNPQISSQPSTSFSLRSAFGSVFGNKNGSANSVITDYQLRPISRRGAISIQEPIYANFFDYMITRVCSDQLPVTGALNSKKNLSANFKKIVINIKEKGFNLPEAFSKVK